MRTGPVFRHRAFTLIELLAVVAIVAILAALLLPALTQAKARAKRVECVGQLRQVGVAFHAFAHDHNSQFPMSVPAAAGGSQELAEGGYRIPGDFYFGYKHFLPVSNELVKVSLLTCPSDTRPPAATFATLQNSNLSYFIGVTAQFSQPNSILSGDRNLTNDWTAPSTILQFGPTAQLRWTEELHRFKGSVLFADGHVEEPNGLVLAFAGKTQPPRADLIVPTLKPSGASPRVEPPAARIPPPPSPLPPLFRSSQTQAVGAPQPVTAAAPSGGETAVSTPAQVRAPAVSEAVPPPPPPATPREAAPGITPAVSNVVPPAVPETGPQPFAEWFAGVMHGVLKKGLWALYLLLLLLLLAAVALRRRLLRRRGDAGLKRPLE